MIKNVAYFPNQCALNSQEVMNRLLDCLQARGIQTQENSMNSDAVIIWSVLWHGRMASNKQVYQHYKNQGKAVICVDIGALYRGTTWKIAIDNINALGRYGHTENLDWDRPRKLGISLATQTIPKPYILIAAQHRNSLQLDGINLEQWINNQITQIQQVSDRLIYVRPHPRCQLNRQQLPTNILYEVPKKLADTYDSFDMHFDCHAVVNYNSGPGIQAAISGARPIVDSSSLAYPVSVKVDDIEKPYITNRDQWLVEICHTEYTLDEIQRGVWINRLML